MIHRSLSTGPFSYRRRAHVLPTYAARCGVIVGLLLGTMACPPAPIDPAPCDEQGDTDCPPTVCVNGTVDGVCLDCTEDSCTQGTLCHPELRRCVQCARDADCGVGVCHPSALVCVSCWNDAQCGDGFCGPDNVCIQCTEDFQCPSGDCNTVTGKCIGGCRRDADCDDTNPCTADRCTDDYICDYETLPDGSTCDEIDPCLNSGFCLAGSCVASTTDCCPDAPECGALSVASDTNADGCLDRCVCVDGAEVGPEGSCVPICNATAVACPEGSSRSDTDGDGCADECICTSPGCVACSDATVCSDEDVCTQDLCVNGICVFSELADCGTCESSCDCLKLGASDAFAVPCPLDCATCGNHWFCDAGSCVVQCGEQPKELTACSCQPPTCGLNATAKDTDNDGCEDTCICPNGQPEGDAGCVVQACSSSCECFGLTPQTDDSCLDTCPGCLNQWLCVGGLCQEICGQAPVGTTACTGGELCEVSGGQWADDACGDSQCGAAPPCIGEAKGGCDCGPSANFDAVEGCLEDLACLEPAGLCPVLSCAKKLGSLDTDGDGCPDTCVCDTNDICAGEELCLKPTGNCDALGTCAKRPSACPPVGTSDESVCGCNGTTYSSACDALKEGSSVASKGTCP